MNSSAILNAFCAICRGRAHDHVHGHGRVFLDDNALLVWILTQAYLPLHFPKITAFEEEKALESSCRIAVVDMARKAANDQDAVLGQEAS